MGYVLVTGCNGFIGKAVTYSLLEKGHKVLGLSTGTSEIKTSENFKYVNVDLTDCLKLENIFKEHRINSVIHLAAIAHLKNRKNIDWNTFYRVNTLASKNLFKCAVAEDADIFYASTVDVYGINEGTEVFTEESKTNPISDYAKSKYLGEKMLEKHRGKINYLIARFAPVYGSNFMKDVYKRIYIKYPKLAFRIGKGLNYHFVSIKNIVDFILIWVNNPSKFNGIINICDNNSINSIEFLELERKNSNIKFVIYIPKSMLSILNIFVNCICRVFPLNLFNKVRINLNKLIKPPKYSILKMNKVYEPKWNLKNTVYK